MQTDPNQSGVDEPAAPADAARGGDALGDLAAHARRAWAAGRARLSLVGDEAIGGIHRFIAWLVLTLFALVVSAILTVVGVLHLVAGAIAGCERWFGSRWLAELVVGASCLAFAVLASAIPLWRSRRSRMAKLRVKYASSAEAG